MNDRKGQQFGSYRLLHLLGQGGFADVYLGEHVSNQSLAAVKVMRMHITNVDVQSFLQEARTIASLQHPHIVQVLEFGVQEKDNTPFLVMNYAPNGTLRQFYPRGAIVPAESILDHFKQVASALQYAHDQNLIHRDVKPENMLMGQYNTVLLSDFGLAVIAQTSRHQNPQAIDGTLPYMAPEQFQGKPRPASDQYALGIVVYEWLCGTRPFNGTANEIQAQQLHASPEPLRKKQPAISPAVEEVVLIALSKDPYRRFVSIQELVTAFEEACKQPDYVVRRRVWNVPYPRNLFFTGREDILKRLYETLRQNQAAALTEAQAIVGLGGIGKTQTAVEYAYRYRHNYQIVLWIKADSPEVLVSDLVAAAGLLNLPEKDEQDQGRVVNAVKHWLEANTSWLLILDNVEDSEIISAFIPRKGNGHVLLTTRVQTIGTIAQGIDLEKMELDEGALFLLRRANIVPPNAPSDRATDVDLMAAREISQTMDGLPLALDQAGAYIEETDCGLKGYLQLYQTQQYSRQLLKARSGPITKSSGRPVTDHPESVATTLSLSFENVQKADPAAADLLRLCAFLHPDAIPEEIFTDGAPDLGRRLRPVAANQIKLDAAISQLRRHSLVRRDPNARTLTLHRLVQAILKDGMSKGIQHRWAERAVRAVNRTFPNAEFPAWQRCQRCLPEAQACLTLIKDEAMTFPEAARLLHQAGVYLRSRAQYSQAEPLLLLSQSIREQTLGPDHPDVAISMDLLADLYMDEGKFVQAESLYRRALTIREQALAGDHTDIAVSLKNVAQVCYFIDSSKYTEAEQFFERALVILEKNKEPEHLDMASLLESIAFFYDYQGDYLKAEPLLERVLAIRETALGENHPRVSNSLANLAHAYMVQGKYTLAVTFYQRALAIWEALDPEHPDVGHILDGLALISMDQGHYTQAEPLLLRMLAIHEKALGPDHHDIAQCLNNLAWLYYLQGKYARSEQCCERALRIHEQTVGVEHADVAIVLNTLVTTNLAQGKYAEAKPLLERASHVLEKDQRPEHPLVAATLDNWANLYLSQGTYDQAEMLFKQVLAIREKAYGSEQADVVESSNNLATLYFVQGKYNQAESLCRRALETLEKTSGSEHPQAAQILNTLALLCSAQGKYDEAERLCKQALAIFEQVLGPTHPSVARCLNTLAEAYSAQGKYVQAKPLYKRAQAIREKIWPSDHPDIAQSLSSLAEFYLVQGKYKRAEKFCKQALAIREKIWQLDHPDIAQNLGILGRIYQAQGKYSKAEPLYKQALRIFEETLGLQHPNVLKVEENYIELLRKMNWETEAAELEKRIGVVLQKLGKTGLSRTIS